MTNEQHQKHLADCAASTQESQELVQELQQALEAPEPTPEEIEAMLAKYES